jgi:hypothetical protein
MVGFVFRKAGIVRGEGCMYFFELYMQLGGRAPFKKGGSCICNRSKGIFEETKRGNRKYWNKL